jgi:hypothetical protein
LGSRQEDRTQDEMSPLSAADHSAPRGPTPSLLLGELQASRLPPALPPDLERLGQGREREQTSARRTRQ